METIERLGNYEIRRTLGRGAMGVVYEGWDPKIERQVAIKTVRIPDEADEEMRDEFARFKREAQAAGRLVHPNIVGVYEYGETEDLAYIVMEYIGGPSLKSLMEKQGRLALPEILRVMRDLLEGLQYSHDRGVVHRDIKPANIMLTSEDRGTARAKIADFGIARIESSSMTQAGTIMGTPAYMSPEQLVGQAVDARTDIYSAGVLLYQLLTGERPFEGGLSAIMHKALNTEAPRPSEIAVTVPTVFDAIVHKAMAKRPDDRYRTAAEFAAALTGLDNASSTDEPTLVTSRPAPRSAAGTAAGTTTPSATPTPSRMPLIGGIAAVVVLLLAGGGWFLLRAPTPQQTASQTASPPPAVPSSGTTAGSAPPAAGTGSATGVPAAPPATPSPGAMPSPALQPQTPAPNDIAQPQTPPPAAQPSPSPPAAQPQAPVASVPPSPQPQPPAPATSAPPAPVATPAPAPAPVVTAASLRAQIAQILTPPRCAMVEAELRSGNDVVLSGVGSLGARDELRRQLGGLTGIGTIEWRGRIADTRYCEALDVLQSVGPILSDGHKRVGLGLMDGRVALHDGERIRPRIALPDFAAYVTVDYITNDGTALHLYPQTADPAHGIAGDAVVRLKPADMLTLGEPSSGHPVWEVGEPFGTDMIMVIASSQPLFATPRPANAEAAQDYVRALSAAVEAAHRAGTRMSGNALLLEVLPK